MFINLNYKEFCERSGKDSEQTLKIRDSLPQTGVWLAGGAIRRTLIGHTLDSDYDFFFKSQVLKDKWEEYVLKSYKKTKETIHHTQYENEEGTILQGINFKFYETAQEVIGSFDYTITMFALDGESLITTPEALWDLGRKRLAINKITYPVASLRRMIKYSNQGFSVCGGCMANLFTETIENPMALSQLDIQYID